ncbi:hypothetical protein NQ317_018769 [Molorchus minor]|uniref:RWD domain-containing protein n=1 Tax=Molorchus minor TaxID=1323400 RepID=A0ABQ9J6D2_9CUCU|nr:hypothetical protein NQ317_018769 [Molorchus minor]
MDPNTRIVNFPNAYPHGVPPVFQIVNGSTVNDAIGTQLLQTLNHLAQQRVSKNRPCLESCLRQMVTTLEQLSTDIDTDRIYERPYIEPIVFGGYNDAYIPFPRTSGAKFCSVGTLAVVHIYDALSLFFVNKQLAEEYILDGDVGTICKHNTAAAAVVGRWDLVQAWTLAELVAGPQQADEEMSMSVHPFGNQLMQSLITHYASQSDIQMAAMLCCIFGKDQEMAIRKSSLKSLLSPGLQNPLLFQTAINL